MTTLAVGLTPMETRRDVVLHVATRAEELGYDAFFLAEGWGHDAAVLLTEVALRTSRIRLGTAVLNVWGRSAASLAMLAGSLDAVSGGRFSLGLGAGSPQLAEGLHDVVFADPVGRLATVTRQVRSLLDGGRLAPSAARRERPLRLADAPGSVPVELAALGPRAVRVAGELADGWLPFLLPFSALSGAVEELDAATAAAGRPAGSVLVSPFLPAAVSDDPARARELASWWVGFYLTSMGPLYRDALRRAGLGAAVDAVLAANPDRGGTTVPREADVLLDELTVHGGPDDARTALDRWRAAGATRPVLTLPPNRPRGELDDLLAALAPTHRWRRTP